MKIYILSCLALLVFIGAQTFAQKNKINIIDNEKIERRIRDSSEFIFEGTVISNDCYHRTDSKGIKHLESSKIIRIDKVFRGNLKLGTIELIHELNQTYFYLYPFQGLMFI